MNPALMRRRIEKLRRDQEKAEAELATLGAVSTGSAEEFPELLGRIPYLARRCTRRRRS